MIIIHDEFISLGEVIANHGSYVGCTLQKLNKKLIMKKFLLIVMATLLSLTTFAQSSKFVTRQEFAVEQYKRELYDFKLEVDIACNTVTCYTLKYNGHSKSSYEELSEILKRAYHKKLSLYNIHKETYMTLVKAGYIEAESDIDALFKALLDNVESGLENFKLCIDVFDATIE